MKEKDRRLLELHEDSPVPEWNRPAEGPRAVEVADDHPLPPGGPGKCQLCGAFGTCVQYWPRSLPARYLDLCPGCREPGEAEIMRRVDFSRRRDGAVV